MVLLLAVGSYWPIRGAILSGMDRESRQEFLGATKSLQTLQQQRLEEMRHAGELIMNIPELRSLIALKSSELDAGNIESLDERLDNFAPLLNVQFVCVLDGDGKLIAQNEQSPWPSLNELWTYLSKTPSPRALAERVYHGDGSSQDGLWLYDSKLYQVVGLPLTFAAERDGDPPDVEGALILATPLGDDLAMDLADSHQCQVSLVAGNQVLASSLPGKLRKQLDYRLASQSVEFPEIWPCQLGDTNYQSAFESLVDQATGTIPARMLIQSSQQEALAQESAVMRKLIWIGAAGLLAAAVASFLFSMAVTRPVQKLVNAVRRVGHADLSVVIEGKGRDELAELSRAFNDMVDQIRVRRALEKQVERARDMTIFAVAKLAESRDTDTGAHLERVRNYSRILAQNLADHGQFAGVVTPEFIQLIYLTSPLHDIGKVGIPDAVLLKPGKLSEREYEIMKSHASIGAATLDAAAQHFPGVQFLEMGRDIAAAHHEKFDGSGYPNGLSGDAIPLAARIVALADVYDALTSKRVYKPAYSHDAAKAIIEKSSGSHFDPHVFEAFLRCENEFAEILQQHEETRVAA
jgi:putative two-component system response regulator